MSKNLIMEETTNTILSDKYEDIFTSSENIPVYIDTDVSLSPEIFKKYEYPVSTWPVIIDQKIAKEFRKQSTIIPSLLTQIPTLYFNDDVKRIGDFYFGGNEMAAEFALMCHKKNHEVACRLDLMVTDNGPKLLEVNMGSGMGGWQICSFVDVLRNLIPGLIELEKTDRVVFRNTQYKYMEFLVDKIFQYVEDVTEELNIFTTIDQTDPHAPPIPVILEYLNSLLEEILSKRGLTGSFYNAPESSLKLDEGDLHLDGKRIHGVLNMDGRELPADVFRAFIMDRIYWPDNLASALYKDKRNLVLLLEMAQEQKFKDPENRMLLDAIPWTSIIEDKLVEFRDKEQNLLQLLRNRKDDFVIKVAKGFQGINVFVGKYLNDEEWLKAIELASGKIPFIAQEFSESLDYLAPDKENNWKPHKLVWGTFGFGQKYGGAFVRMSAVGSGNGVINSAAGANEALVYESIA